MKQLCYKELFLSASPLSYWFLAFSAMTFLPGYPIALCGFFFCFGIFHTFQGAREANDVLYTALLPVSKRDVVKARLLFVMLIQMTGWLLCAIFVAVRMLALPSVTPYVTNPMMNANLAYLGTLLWIFSAFLLCFVRPFYATAYRLGIPFLKFGIASFLIIGLGEALHHLPWLPTLNAPDRVDIAQLWVLVSGVCAYVLSFCYTWKSAQKSFEKIDL